MKALFIYNVAIWVMIALKVYLTDEWTLGKAIVFGMCVSFIWLYVTLPFNVESASLLACHIPQTAFGTFTCTAFWWGCWRRC